MSVLDLLKSGPGMATAGTVGVGGAAAALFGAGVFGSGASESTFTLPKEDAKTFIKFDESKAKTAIFNLKRSGTGKDNEVKQTNDYFGNISISCLNSMFPGIKFHPLDKFKLDEQQQTKTDEWPKLIQPSEDHSGTVEGCSSMALSRDNEYFLMTSEAVVKRGKEGMALWTGMKSSGAPNKTKLRVKARHFVVFFSSENGKDWKSLGGYSWAWKEENRISAITIQSPEKVINETITSSNTGSQTIHKAHYGIWKLSQETGSPSPLNISKENNNSNVVVNPNKAFALYNADYFLPPSHDYSNETHPWKQYCTKGTSCSQESRTIYKEDVVNNYEKWLRPYQGQKGSWVSASS